MPAPEHNDDQMIREAAYFIWEREGRLEGRALNHWLQAAASQSSRATDRAEDEEKVLAGRPDANIPALLTKDVPGG